MSTPKGSGLSEGGANKRQKFKDLLLSLESIQKIKNQEGQDSEIKALIESFGDIPELARTKEALQAFLEREKRLREGLRGESKTEQQVEGELAKINSDGKDKNGMARGTRSDQYESICRVVKYLAEVEEVLNEANNDVNVQEVSEFLTSIERKVDQADSIGALYYRPEKKESERMLDFHKKMQLVEPKLNTIFLDTVHSADDLGRFNGVMVPLETMRLLAQVQRSIKPLRELREKFNAVKARLYSLDHPQISDKQFENFNRAVATGYMPVITRYLKYFSFSREDFGVVLVTAAKNGHVAIVKGLLQKDLRAGNVRDALFWAIEENKPIVAQVLLEAYKKFKTPDDIIKRATEFVKNTPKAFEEHFIKATSAFGIRPKILKTILAQVKAYRGLGPNDNKDDIVAKMIVSVTEALKKLSPKRKAGLQMLINRGELGEEIKKQFYTADLVQKKEVPLAPTSPGLK